MERGLYSSAAGMAIAERWMDVISQNLANASTTAYKRDVLVFNEGLERMLQSGDETLGKLGAGPGEYGVFTIQDVGLISQTGAPLDVALQSPGAMFQVQTDRGVFFTRNGRWTLNQGRELVTGTGAKVLDDSGSPIVLPAGRVEISDRGVIEVNGQRVGQLGLFTGNFVKLGDGLYKGDDPVAAEPGSASVLQGAIEGSNVNAIEEMIAMIKLNRAFEMAQKSAQGQDESTQRLLQILQDR